MQYINYRALYVCRYHPLAFTNAERERERGLISSRNQDYTSSNNHHDIGLNVSCNVDVDLRGTIGI